VFVHGFGTMNVIRGTVAIEMMARHRIDVVVTREVTGDISGNDFVRRIRADARTAHIPVVVLVESTRPDSMMEAQAAGASTVLPTLGNLDVFLRVIVALTELPVCRSSHPIETTAKRRPTGWAQRSLSRSNYP
jgi:DNA-binding NarL/FixJ family response regulator